MVSVRRTRPVQSSEIVDVFQTLRTSAASVVGKRTYKRI